MSSVALFQRLVPEFAALTDIEERLEDAAAAHNAAAFGSRYAEAMCLYAGHFAKLEDDATKDATKGSSSAGPVTSRKTGDNAETYTNRVSSGDTEAARFFLSTTYGARYYRIVRTRSAGRATFYLPA